MGGVVFDNRHGSVAGQAMTKWSDLSPFAQGYIEALFASLNASRSYMPGDGQTGARELGFCDLAPETLARVIADCGALVAKYPGWNVRDCGPLFWSTRQAGFRDGFPPLTVHLGDDGKVRFEQ